MRRAHRKTHLILWLFLSPIILGVLIRAVLHRPAAPVNDTLPDIVIEEAH